MYKYTIHIEFTYVFARIRICVGVNMYEIGGTLANLIMNHILIHITRREILRDFEFEVKSLFLPTYSKETHFQKFASADSKNFDCTELEIKF